VVDGHVVGSQGVFSTEWHVTRTVETGSRLGRWYQGRGLGREMRSAVLHLAFDGFGAERAVSCAYADNGASLAVTSGPRLPAERPGPGPARRSVGDAGPLRDGPRDFGAIRRDDVEVLGAADVVAPFGTERPRGRPNPGS
jgi:hypothetical protein